MNLVEQHIIDINHSFYKECDELCFKSKNIYNLSLYRIKEGLKENSFDVINRLYHIIKVEDCFKDLPNKVSTATIISAQKCYKSYFNALKSYKLDQSKFKGVPSEPKFLNKTNGRYIISYNYQAISSSVYKKEHKIKLSGTNISFYTKIDSFDKINCVRIVPGLNQYVIEVCYSEEDIKPIRDNKRYLSIDLGVNNLATITSNVKEVKPIIINGRPLKSINQYYNKKKSDLQSELEVKNKKKYSKRIKRLTNKRNNKVKNYLHKSSKLIIKHCVDNNISKLIIGKNDNWKQEVNIGKKNNQNFVSIPHTTFISMLDYKCQKSGIRVITNEESYTSKCSFLDNESIEKHEVYLGKRVKRGLFKSSKGKFINADVNGSYNILRKVIHVPFEDGIEGVVVNPVKLNIKFN